MNRIKYDVDGVPRVLILVTDKEQVLEVTSRFEILNRNTAVLIRGLYAAPGIETQMNELADGADIVIATPERARAIYLKLGLNLNKVDLFIIDDADKLVKQGLQLPVSELATSIGKCQHLVFTEVMHDKLHKMIDPFMKLPALIEAEEAVNEQLTVIPQIVYHVPDFGTKLNLLNLFMQDEELFTKTAVFVNTRQTAETVYKSLQNRMKDAVVLLHPGADQMVEIQRFKELDKRVLVINNETFGKSDLTDIPFILHFEVPVEKETYIERIIADEQDDNKERLSIIFTTDLELSAVKKIEQATGHKIQVGELPAGTGNS